MSKALKYFKGDELAAKVWLDKYAYDGELSPDEMHMRMAEEFGRIEFKHVLEEREFVTSEQIQALSSYGEDRLLLNDEEMPKHQLQTHIVNNHYKLLHDFNHIVPQGSIMSTLGTPIIASLSNCWVEESPLDSYAGILHTDANLAFYYKRRGGVGTDLSNLRPKGTATNNTAKTTTGVVSFMPRFSNTTREVAMDGRRGALMLSISINHPDSMDFIKSKRDGVSITGANISVRLNDEFMNAVINDEDYILRFPVDASIPEDDWDLIMEYDKLEEFMSGDEKGKFVFFKRIKAREYWNEIVKSATNHAEPGIMYWDNVLSYDPAAVYEQFKPISSNPCGEQFLNANDSCRLMALNLYGFVINPFTDEAEIDYEKLYEVAYEHTRMGDNLIDLELEYIQRIMDKIKSDPEPYHIKEAEYDLWEKSYKNTKAGRRVGLGITALADMLAAINVQYGSEESLEVIEKVMCTKMEAELDCTIDLAILRGTFEGYELEKEYTLSPNKDIILYGNNNFYTSIALRFPKQVERMKKYGRRNVSWSTIAPTGSVSLLTQSSSGCEPLFAPYHIRRKKINPSEVGVKVDFIDELGDKWQEFPVLHEKFKEWLKVVYEVNDSAINGLSKELLDIHFKNSPWYGATANDIPWEKRNEVQALLQKYTTNAISSTINLPKGTPEETVSNIYLQGWELGLKGQTVYVDGSRSGVLITDSNVSSKLKHTTAPKRPKELICETHSTKSNGIRYNVFVGLLDGEPYEIFLTEYFTSEPTLVLKKIKRGRYDLYKGKEVYSEDISSNMTDEQEAITRLVSTSLRHGAEIKFVVEQLQKTSSEDMFSFTKSLARVLKKYILNGAKSTVVCTECGSTEVIFEEGCNKCLSCGHSACS